MVPRWARRPPSVQSTCSLAVTEDLQFPKEMGILVTGYKDAEMTQKGQEASVRYLSG